MLLVPETEFRRLQQCDRKTSSDILGDVKRPNERELVKTNANMEPPWSYFTIHILLFILFFILLFDPSIYYSRILVLRKIKYHTFLNYLREIPYDINLGSCMVAPDSFYYWEGHFTFRDLFHYWSARWFPLRIVKSSQSPISLFRLLLSCLFHDSNPRWANQRACL
jgi:hypothetical protein